MSTSRQRSWAEPFKIKMVEAVKITTPEERQHAHQAAGYNTFLLRSEDVYIDLLTDSGTSAMSDRQWASMMLGDEAYAGSRSFYRMEHAVQTYYGYKHVVPTHQGRGAENLISKVLIKPGDVVPGNMYFTTTRLHQELAGGTFVDIIIDQAHDPASTHPFKGDVDLQKLSRRYRRNTEPQQDPLRQRGRHRQHGRRPADQSSPTCAQVRALCRKHGIRIILDATRAVENAYFIKAARAGCRDMTIAEILRELCDLTDGCTMSAKKDALVNIGGFLAVNDDEVFDAARNMVVVYEGLHTYGGMAGRDMEAVAIGSARVGRVRPHPGPRRAGRVPGPQADRVRRTDRRTRSAATACSSTPRRSCRTCDQDVYPAQTLAAEIYLEGGVRTMERGNVSAGRDPKTGKNRRPRLELVRVTIPRRVYTQAHMDVTAERSPRSTTGATPSVVSRWSTSRRRCASSRPDSGP